MDKEMKEKINALCAEAGIDKPLVVFRIDEPIQVFWKDLGAQVELGRYIIHEPTAIRIIPPGLYITWLDGEHVVEMVGTDYSSFDQGVAFKEEDADELHEQGWLVKLS